MSTYKATIVTALFDIQRNTKGDGRTVEQYVEWFKKTLLVNCPMIIFCEEKFAQLAENRPCPTKVIVQSLKDASYYKYINRMNEILNSPEYKCRISCPERIECRMAEYSIIQYSKFGWLEHTIEENPFNTENFYWIDAGCSRFFLDVDLSRPYPSKTLERFTIQGRNDLDPSNITDDFIWDCKNYLIGTMFGGPSQFVLQVGKLVEEQFNHMIDNNNVNNEQLALAIVWKRHPELFSVVINDTRHHLILFKHLS